MPILKLRPHQQTAVNSMWQQNKGQVIMPTGSGKTITMIDDMTSSMMKDNQTIVVVGPTIALTNQLSREFLELVDDVSVMHVHSGNTGHFTSTSPLDIFKFNKYTRGHKLIFTTYHSLHRIEESMISVDTIYFDEAHNSVQRQFFPSVKYFSQRTTRCFFFTASPKHSQTPDKPGMNNTQVYGDIICEVPTTEMIQQGYIVPPTLHTITSDDVVSGKYPAEVDINHLINAIDQHELNSVLVSCKNTTQLYHVSTSERFTDYCRDNDYTIYSICSRYGCFIDDEKVRRDVMFRHMSNNHGKFIVFHVECLCEGINLPKLEGIVLLKKLNTIKLIQSIGRVLRLSEGKTDGKVILPQYSKYLTKTQPMVETMMEKVYDLGQTPVEIIRK